MNKITAVPLVLMAMVFVLVMGCVIDPVPVSYTHLTLPTTSALCRSRWSPYH